jgi:uncharacterized metal-binding protein YceD (DUF177 family)
MAAAGEPTGRASDDDGWDLADELYKHGEKLGLSPVAAQVIAKAALDSGVVVPAAVAAEAQRERDEARAELERLREIVEGCDRCLSEMHLPASVEALPDE